MMQEQFSRHGVCICFEEFLVDLSVGWGIYFCMLQEDFLSDGPVLHDFLGCHPFNLVQW